MSQYVAGSTMMDIIRREHCNPAMTMLGVVTQGMQEDMHAAVKHALRLGAIGFEAVKHLILCRVERRPPRLDLDVYPYLPRANVAKTSAASYLSLMSGGAR